MLLSILLVFICIDHMAENVMILYFNHQKRGRSFRCHSELLFLRPLAHGSGPYLLSPGVPGSNAITKITIVKPIKFNRYKNPEQLYHVTA